MIEGSRSGSVPLTNGSGSRSRRPKNGSATLFPGEDLTSYITIPGVGGCWWPHCNSASCRASRWSWWRHELHNWRRGSQWPFKSCCTSKGGPDFINSYTWSRGSLSPLLAAAVGHATSRGEPDDVINNHTWSRGCWWPRCNSASCRAPTWSWWRHELSWLEPREPVTL